MRQRLEDLGRIYVMIDNILELDVLEEPICRKKDYYDWFNDQSDEKKCDIIDKFVYGLEDVRFKLHDILAIAGGLDDMNNPPE